MTSPAMRDPWARAYSELEPPRPPNPHLSATLSQLALKPGASALDLGCGSGRHLRLLEHYQLRPTGIDLSPAALAQSRRAAGSVSLAQASVDAMPFGAESFDLVVAWGVLFHLRMPQLLAALGEIRRVLTREGVAILHALDPADWRRDPNAGPEHRREIASRHVDGVIDSYFPIEEIEAMLSPHFAIVSRQLVHTQHDYGLSAEWAIVARPLPG